MTVGVSNPQDPAFERWLETQLSRSASAMLRSISPVSIVKHRAGFGQTVRPVAGAIVASPVLGDYNPDPDYFFHWFRDSAVVIDALRLLYAQRRIGDEALGHLRDFTRFSLAVNGLDGRAVAAVPGRQARVAPELLQYLREDHELASVHGDAVSAETRVNPDGTLDILKWARPQHDGPPLRAMALLRWVAGGHLDAALQAEVAPLIRFDIDFTLRHWRERPTTSGRKTSATTTTRCASRRPRWPKARHGWRSWATRRWRGAAATNRRPCDACSTTTGSMKEAKEMIAMRRAATTVRACWRAASPARRRWTSR